MITGEQLTIAIAVRLLLRSIAFCPYSVSARVARVALGGVAVFNNQLFPEIASTPARYSLSRNHLCDRLR